MRWHQHDAYALVSDCGRYSVARIGLKGGDRYEVWRTRKHPDGPRAIAVNLATVQQAVKIATADEVSS